MTDIEKTALKKVYDAIRRAQEVEDAHGAGEWMFWKDLSDIEIKILNAIGCPRDK